MSLTYIKRGSLYGVKHLRKNNASYESSQVLRAVAILEGGKMCDGAGLWKKSR